MGYKKLLTIVGMLVLLNALAVSATLGSVAQPECDPTFVEATLVFNPYGMNFGMGLFTSNLESGLPYVDVTYGSFIPAHFEEAMEAHNTSYSDLAEQYWEAGPPQKSDIPPTQLHFFLAEAYGGDLDNVLDVELNCAWGSPGCPPDEDILPGESESDFMQRMDNFLTQEYIWGVLLFFGMQSGCCDVESQCGVYDINEPEDYFCADSGAAPLGETGPYCYNSKVYYSCDQKLADSGCQDGPYLCAQDGDFYHWVESSHGPEWSCSIGEWYECTQDNMCDTVAQDTCYVDGNAPTGWSWQENPNMPDEELICDGLDNDCDGVIDEGCDDDNDDFCDASGFTFPQEYTCDSDNNPNCCELTFSVENELFTDCDDNSPMVAPNILEMDSTTCTDGIDNDCNGWADASDHNCNTDYFCQEPMLVPDLLDYKDDPNQWGSTACEGELWCHYGPGNLEDKCDYWLSQQNLDQGDFQMGNNPYYLYQCDIVGSSLADGILWDCIPITPEMEEDAADFLVEEAQGELPNYMDSDFDGLPDVEEPDVICDVSQVQAYLDPDCDNDGINDGDESIDTYACSDGFASDGHTSMLHDDSDGDGFPDGAEVEAGFDPTCAADSPQDTDFDCIPDSVENQIFGVCDSGLDPFEDNDCDADGLHDGNGLYKIDGSPMTDDMKVPHFGNLIFSYEDLNCNGHKEDTETSPQNVDSDGDGVGDYEEFTDEQESAGYYLSPVLFDTDKDGIPDSCALGPGQCDFDYSINICESEDLDNDALVNGAETNPRLADSDGDGFEDGAECAAYTDPLDDQDFPLDTDGDGIPDVVEGDGDPDGDGNPNYDDEDSDNDCIDDIEEDANGNGVIDQVMLEGEMHNAETDPYNVDTDGDGLNDGLEANCDGNYDPGETDPRRADTDGDQIDDYAEKHGYLSVDEQDTYYTSATNPDHDGDGLEEGEEVFVTYTNPMVADSDGDSFSDGDEVEAGSDPLNEGEDPQTLCEVLDETQCGDDPVCEWNAGSCDTIFDPVPPQQNGGGNDGGNNNDDDDDTPPPQIPTGDFTCENEVQDNDEVGVDCENTCLYICVDGSSSGECIDDLDCDGWLDSVEAFCGGDASNPDIVCPGDNALDGWDADQQEALMNMDTDLDDISNYDELAGTFGFVTNPNNDDTDGDGYFDDEEIEAGSDPTNEDSDPETVAADNDDSSDDSSDSTPPPGGPDSDGDGIPDDTEGDGDCDGDGIPNFLDIDSDNDGITDNLEDRNYNGVQDADETGVCDPDSDGDGIQDGAEDILDFDPLDPNDTPPDADGDGIPDAIEGDGDSDGDGTPDYLDDDSDNDGIPDYLEDKNGNGELDIGETSPTLADTDGDGLSDAEEDANQNGIVDAGETNPASADTDGDGFLDLEEILLGSDPTDGTSIPEGEEPRVAADHQRVARERQTRTNLRSPASAPQADDDDTPARTESSSSSYDDEDWEFDFEEEETSFASLLLIVLAVTIIVGSSGFLVYNNYYKKKGPAQKPSARQPYVPGAQRKLPKKRNLSAALSQKLKHGGLAQRSKNRSKEMIAKKFGGSAKKGPSTPVKLGTKTGTAPTTKQPAPKKTDDGYVSLDELGKKNAKKPAAKEGDDIFDQLESGGKKKKKGKKDLDDLKSV